MFFNVPSLYPLSTSLQSSLVFLSLGFGLVDGVDLLAELGHVVVVLRSEGGQGALLLDVELLQLLLQLQQLLLLLLVELLLLLLVELLLLLLKLLLLFLLLSSSGLISRILFVNFFSSSRSVPGCGFNFIKTSPNLGLKIRQAGK